MSGDKCVWAQTCLITNVCGHKHVWAQTCVGTNVSGHKRVGTIVWAQVCMGTNVRSPKMYINKHCVSCLVVTCMLILLYNLEYLYVYVCKARYIYFHPFFSFSLSSYILFFFHSSLFVSFNFTIGKTLFLFNSSKSYPGSASELKLYHFFLTFFFDRFINL